MKFSYIKSQGHLLEIPLIYEMVALYEVYKISPESVVSGENYQEYYSSQGIDPVKEFILANLSDRLLELSDDSDRDNIVNYIASMFYSVKGTAKVFDLMGRFFSSTIEVLGDIIYNGTTLTVNLRLSDSLYNTVEFRSGLQKFLEALIYTADSDSGSVIITVGGGDDSDGDGGEITTEPGDWTFSGLPQTLGLKETITSYTGGGIRTYRVFLIYDSENTYFDIVEPECPYIGIDEMMQLRISTESSRTIPSIWWESENTNVATVNIKNGLVTGINPGEVRINAWSGEEPGVYGGHSSSVDLIVQSITIPSGNFTIDLGTSSRGTLGYIDSANSGLVLWESSNTSLLDIKPGTGDYEAKREGEVTIRAYNKNNRNICAEITVSIVNTEELSITIDRDTLQLNELSTFRLRATISSSVPGKDVSGLSVAWVSEHNNIASVDSTGLVTGCNSGESRIYARIKGTSVQSECLVTVIDPFTPHVTGLSINEDLTELMVGNSVTLTATVVPVDAARPGVLWYSSDPSAASIGETSGILEAHHESPEVIITAKSEDPGRANDQIILSITPRPTPRIKLNYTRIALTLNDSGNGSKNLVVSLYDFLEDPEISWEINNEAVASLTDLSGRSTTVYAVSQGSAVITVTVRDGNDTYTETCNIVVNSIVTRVTGVSVSPSSGNIHISETLQLQATVYPLDANDQSVSWSSGNSSIASVDLEGLVTGVSVGSTSIVATTTDGGFTSSCTVTVESTPAPPPEPEYYGYLTFTQGNSWVLSMNDHEDIEVHISGNLPRGVIFSVSSTYGYGVIEVMTKDTGWGTGLAMAEIVAVRPGIAELIAVSRDDPSIYASCLIEVNGWG